MQVLWAPYKEIQTPALQLYMHGPSYICIEKYIYKTTPEMKTYPLIKTL